MGTPNYDWPVPDYSDLPDGPAQIAALGVAADAALKAEEVARVAALTAVGEDVDDLEADLSSQAALIAGLQSATAWTNWTVVPLTDTTNFSVYAVGQDIRYAVFGPLVCLLGAIATNTAGYVDSASLRTFANLPSIARPTTMSRNFTQIASGNNKWALDVNPNGNISACRFGPGASAAGNWLTVSGIYIK